MKVPLLRRNNPLPNFSNTILMDSWLSKVLSGFVNYPLDNVSIGTKVIPTVNLEPYHGRRKIYSDTLGAGTGTGTKNFTITPDLNKMWIPIGFVCTASNIDLDSIHLSFPDDSGGVARFNLNSAGTTAHLSYFFEAQVPMLNGDLCGYTASNDVSADRDWETQMNTI